MSAITWAANECHWSCRFSVCHVSTPQCTTHTQPHLPFLFLLHSPSYHVGSVLISAEIPRKFQSGGEKKKNCTSVIFLIKLISLKILQNRSQLNVCCDLFSFSFFFRFSHGYRIFSNSLFSPSPYKTCRNMSKEHFSYSQQAYTPSLSHLLILTTVSLAVRTEKQPFYCVPKEKKTTALWPVGGFFFPPSLCRGRIQDFSMTWVLLRQKPRRIRLHLTSTVLHGLAFTVQMYMCMGVLSCCPCTFQCPFVSAGMCVSEAIFVFVLRASTVLSRLAGPLRLTWCYLLLP